MKIIELIIQWLFNLAVVINAIMIYLNINKLWRTKHEAIVAESISVGAKALGISIAGIFLLNFIVKKDYGSSISYLLFLISDIIFFLVGIGFWVRQSKNLGIGKRFFRSLKQEKSEVGNLVKAVATHQSQRQLLEILNRLAWLNKELHKKQIKCIEVFTEDWNLNIRYIISRQPKERGVEKYQCLCQVVREYLKEEPPKEQVELLCDLIKTLIEAAEKITQEEEIISEEILGILNKYIGKNEINVYRIIIHPKTREQENDILSRLSDAKVEFILGDRALLAGFFHTKRYAEVIGESYRDQGWFTVVHHYGLT
jgi:hypothetical protein